VSDAEITKDAGVVKVPWWKVAVEVSALVTVLVATVYAIGLFALWLPIATSVTHDYLTSWYAVSLMPRMVVIGQGIQVLFGVPLLAPLIVVLILWCVFFISSLTQRLRRKQKETKSKLFLRTDFDTLGQWFNIEKETLKFLLFVDLGIAAVAVIVSVVLGSDLWHWLPIYFISSFGGMIASDFMKRATMTEGRWGRPQIASRKWLARTFLTFYLTFVLNSLAGILYASPNLLFVSMEEQKDLKFGRLVAHADGYWHIIDGQGTLRAIPDEEAGAVRVSSEKTANP